MNIYEMLESYSREAPDPENANVLLEKIKAQELYLLPIQQSNETIGFILTNDCIRDLSHWTQESLERVGLSHLKKEQLANVRTANLESIYLQPEHRGQNFFRILPDIFKLLHARGFQLFQSAVKPTIAKWMQRRYGVEPVSYMFVANPYLLIRKSRGDA